MPGIDELLRAEGERWRVEVDGRCPTTAAAPMSAAPAAVAPATSATTRAPRTARPRRLPPRRVLLWSASLSAVAASVVLAVAALTADGGGGTDRTASSSSAAAAAKAPAQRARNAAPVSAGGMADLQAGAGRVPSARPTVRPASSSLILTGTMSLSVRSNAAVDTAATRATGIADGAGGRVDADSRSSANHDATSTATLVLRVPNAALPSVADRLAALGTVRSRNLQTKDVTTEVADVNSRVTSARAAIAGLTRLYTRANTVRDLITVESALTARQSDLEALEAQQRTLSAQTSLATLTVSIDVRAPATAKHTAHRGGFTGGLHNGWHAFTATLHAIATGVGAALPFLVVVLIIGAGGALAIRRRQPRPSPDPEP
ncbi:DUF4349 domain-containing protein [uncultured Jatrophihabitans sp.]|uniref:DUF4349 domain-containing protein n=1 Tax=uncultured Jatrophihabitans sp. TaxID=1610747 RepID=UPI0035CB31E7